MSVGVRGDHRRVTAGDFEVVQNLARADAERHFYVPLWSQPGCCRAPPNAAPASNESGTRAFPPTSTPTWLVASGERPWRRGASSGSRTWWGTTELRRATERLDWNDFRSVDLYLAIRPPRLDLYRNKPAGKLFNAWRAGVPAVLGPEIAYREMRRSELDYLEAGTAAEALAAIDRLRADPALYLAMVEHGRQRAAEFADDVIVERWADLLWRVLPQRSGQRPLARLPVWARALVRRVQYQLGDHPRLGREPCRRPAVHEPDALARAGRHALHWQPVDLRRSLEGLAQRLGLLLAARQQHDPRRGVDRRQRQGYASRSRRDRRAAPPPNGLLR